MNTASIIYLADHPRKPRPHAREGIRTARIFNMMTERLCDEVLEAQLAEHMDGVLSELFPDEKQRRRVGESL